MPAIDTTAIRNSVSALDRDDLISGGSSVLAMFGRLGLLTAALTFWTFSLIVFNEVLMNAGVESQLIGMIGVFTFETPVLALLGYVSAPIVNSIAGAEIDKKRAALVVTGVYYSQFAVRLSLNAPYGVG
jgi:hypothetical protein